MVLKVISEQDPILCIYVTKKLCLETPSEFGDVLHMESLSSNLAYSIFKN